MRKIIKKDVNKEELEVTLNESLEEIRNGLKHFFEEDEIDLILEGNHDEELFKRYAFDPFKTWAIAIFVPTRNVALRMRKEIEQYKKRKAIKEKIKRRLIFWKES